SARHRVLHPFPTRRSSDLNESKNQKEYSAVLTQLNTYKADNSKTEERVLELLTAIDEEKKQLVEVEAERAKECAKLEELHAAARDRKSTRLNSSHVTISYA